jgi:hypothetical protein
VAGLHTDEGRGADRECELRSDFVCAWCDLAHTCHGFNIANTKKRQH